jgi:hypothetical protein
MTPPVDQHSVSVETRRRLYRQLLDRAERIPGVDGASASFSRVLSAETWRNAITVAGFVPGAAVNLRECNHAALLRRHPDRRAAQSRVLGRRLRDGTESGVTSGTRQFEVVLSTRSDKQRMTTRLEPSADVLAARVSS